MRFRLLEEFIHELEPDHGDSNEYEVFAHNLTNVYELNYKLSMIKNDPSLPYNKRLENMITNGNRLLLENLNAVLVVFRYVFDDWWRIHLRDYKTIMSGGEYEGGDNLQDMPDDTFTKLLWTISTYAINGDFDEYQNLIVDAASQLEDQKMREIFDKQCDEIKVYARKNILPIVNADAEVGFDGEEDGSTMKKVLPLLKTDYIIQTLKELANLVEDMKQTASVLLQEIENNNANAIDDIYTYDVWGYILENIDNAILELPNIPYYHRFTDVTGHEMDDLVDEVLKKIDNVEDINHTINSKDVTLKLEKINYYKQQVHFTDSMLTYFDRYFGVEKHTTRQLFSALSDNGIRSMSGYDDIGKDFGDYERFTDLWDEELAQQNVSRRKGDVLEN